jgi:hypothetical protein
VRFELMRVEAQLGEDAADVLRPVRPGYDIAKRCNQVGKIGSTHDHQLSNIA